MAELLHAHGMNVHDSRFAPSASNAAVSDADCVVGGSNEVEDEWENDQDIGVYMISLSEEAFFEMERATSRNLQAINMLQQKQVNRYMETCVSLLFEIIVSD